MTFVTFSVGAGLPYISRYDTRSMKGNDRILFMGAFSCDYLLKAVA